MAEESRTLMGSGRQDVRMEQFWKVPLPPECIEFVDSSDSEAFSRFLVALGKASIIAMDAEWKPVFDKSDRPAYPRVSILQIACRLDHKVGVQEELSADLFKDKNASSMTRRTELELVSMLDFEDRSHDTIVSDGAVILQASESEGESDGGGGDSQQSPDFRGDSAKTSFRETGGESKHERLSPSQTRKHSRGDQEELEALGSLLSELDLAITRTEEPIGSELKRPEPRRELLKQSSFQGRVKDGNLVTDASAAQRKFEKHNKSVKESGYRISEDTPTDPGNETKTWPEMIFLLDLLALPVSILSEALKEAFRDPTVLKLGFGFKQDLMNLRATFTGPESHGCFDKVEPYLDVGKLYKHLHSNSSFLHRGKRIMVGGDGLASVFESVLGLPLQKDMQCSNWEQRPLTSEQFDYAAADAYCLLSIFDALQIEASQSWFSAPAGNGGDGIYDGEDGLDDGEVDLWSRSPVGVAGLLAPTNSHKYAVVNICQRRRGSAMVMVEAALGDVAFRRLKEDSGNLETLRSDITGRKTLGVETLVRRFGEKLLISGGQSKASKRMRRKTRSRRARESGKNKEFLDEDDIQYLGPPPWDSKVGGDGVPRFLCDAMVEGLARQLRCVGIDAASLNSKKCEPRELVDLAEKEGRIILTRDVKLLRRKLVSTDLAYRVKKQGKWDQLAEILETFKLSISEDQLLSRCTKCNGNFLSRPLTAKEAAGQGPWNQVIPACALRDVNEFWQCADCNHLYWQGTQFVRAYKQFAAVCLTEITLN